MYCHSWKLSALSVPAGGVRRGDWVIGLGVAGPAHPDAIWARGNATPGDALFLTKPLGTGLVLHGFKRDLAGDAELAEAVRWMRMLNREAADTLRPFQPSAVTGTTGILFSGMTPISKIRTAASKSGTRMCSVNNMSMDASPSRGDAGCMTNSTYSQP